MAQDNAQPRLEVEEGTLPRERGKIPHHIRQFIEQELRDFKVNKGLLQDLRDDIIHGGSREMAGSGGRTETSVSNPTEKRALLLTNDWRLLRLSAVIPAIEETLQELDPIEKRLVDLLYFSRIYANKGVCLQLGMSYPTFIKYRNEVLWKFARRLNL